MSGRVVCFFMRCGGGGTKEEVGRNRALASVTGHRGKWKRSEGWIEAVGTLGEKRSGGR